MKDNGGMDRGPETGDGERLLRVNVAARRLGKSPKTVWRWIREGKLPCCREGERDTRVPAGVLEALGKD